MRNIYLLLLFIGLAINSKSQTSDCLKDFDYLIQKVKSDYPGYQDKVTPETKKDLFQLENKLRNKIQQYPDSCGKYLSSYASWFKDNHLRIKRLYSHSGSDDKTIPAPKTFSGNQDSLMLLNTQSNSIEGIWHSFRGDIAIVKSPSNEEFLGVSISYENYKRKQIIFSLIRLKEDEYAMTAYPYYNDFSPIKGKASVRLGSRVIELHEDTRFVRKTNAPTFDDALLYSYIPEFPNGTNTFPLALKLSDSTFYLRIPSFMDDNAEVLTRKHWIEITSTPNLIIDIRNNGGGQDDFYQILSGLVYTQPYQCKGVEWYATENNIKMYENALKNGDIRNGEEGIRWTNSLLSEMKRNVGGFVIHPMMGGDQTIKNDTIFPYPKRVGIIINEGNASSAEQFLLSAGQSSKVILFGNSNTAGVLDYSNAISENLPSNGFELIFPMTRSRRLPDHPIDNIGISPDVKVPYPSTAQLFGKIDQ
ncbi:MAG: S41 family peptidase [Bacteroidetes bacterium]|nr:S41 family peptidase [Bacteroidota bacterium]